MSDEANYSEAALVRVSPPRRRRWLRVVLALLLFGGGVVTGAGATVVFMVDRVQYAIHHPEVFPERAASRLQRKLDLTDEQRASVESILRVRQARLQAIRREVQPRVEAELEAAREEVAGVLDERQKAEWNEVFNDRRARWLPPLPK